MNYGPDGAYFDPARKQFAWIPKKYQLGNNAVSFAVFDGINWAYEDAIIVVSNSRPLPDSFVADSGYGVVEQYDIFGIFNNTKKAKAQSASKKTSNTEDKKIDEEKLSISSIEIKRSGDGVIVSWKTNKPANERVIYDLDSEANKTKNFTYDYATVESANLDENHSVKLIGLGENKTYYLRAVSSVGDEKIISNEMAFTLDDSLASAGAFAGNLDFLKNPFLYIVIILFVGFWMYFKKRKTSDVAVIGSDIPTVASLKI